VAGEDPPQSKVPHRPGSPGPLGLRARGCCAILTHESAGVNTFPRIMSCAVTAQTAFTKRDLSDALLRLLCHWRTAEGVPLRVRRDGVLSNSVGVERPRKRATGTASGGGCRAPDPSAQRRALHEFPEGGPHRDTPRARWGTRTRVGSSPRVFSHTEELLSWLRRIEIVVPCPRAEPC
jgi:hypothetical protein